MHNNIHTDMEGNVALPIAEFLGLPKLLKWFELEFTSKKRPSVAFMRYDSNVIERKEVSITSDSDLNQYRINKVALLIANMFTEITTPMVGYTLRFEAGALPIVTVTHELHSAYDNGLNIKENLASLKLDYQCTLKDSGIRKADKEDCEC